MQGATFEKAASAIGLKLEITGAGNVAGRDPLYLDPELTPATLSGFLDWVTSTYAGKAYRTNYEWLDHVRHVSDGTLRD